MAIQISQSQSQVPPIPWRPDDKEYTVASSPGGRPIKLLWSEMTRHQKLLQIEAEQWAWHQEQFNPNGIV